MKYSRKEISRSGNILIESKSEEEINLALEKINDWRTNHLQPLKVLKRRLEKSFDFKKINPYLVSQRLKRLTSIIYKLDLNPKMGLGGMQDIGGFRAVLNDVKDLNKVKIEIENNHILGKPEKDSNYIETPKESGYRSIHYIYKYNSNVEKYDSLRVELQIRTKLQHYWATAVETAGIITKTSLKSSQGPDEWLEFFKIVSSLFAIKEKLHVLKIHESYTVEQLMVEFYQICSKLKVIDTLKALNVTTEHLERKRFPGHFYLININLVDQFVNIKVYSKSQYQIATDEYLELEKNIEDEKNAVVLVSANSFKSLQKAYPSYFLDTTEFIDALEKINKNCKRLKLI